MAGSRIAPALPDSPVGQAPGAFLKRPEVRDALAWMRLLVDPQDAAAVVRALARPPVELRQVELARVIQVARRRTPSGGTGKLNLVLGLAAATESPQVPPEARERIQRFVELHRGAAAELLGTSPDAFLAQLIERLSAPGRSLLAPDDAAEQRASLEQLQRLAVEFVRRAPSASARDLVRHLAALAPDTPDAPSDPQAGDSAGSVDAGDPTEELQATLQLLREEVIDGVARIGGRLGELRLDTDLDISHGVVRYLELLKLSALLQRPDGQSLVDAIDDVNARLLAAATPLQREIFQTSTLDDTLITSRAAVGRREEHSLHPFLPRKGIGLALSASDVYTYRSCPLRYKYARVLRIPTEQTVHQRFGIVVHQVLERYHSDGRQALAQLLELLDASWRRAGFGEGARDRELLEKARVALTRYHARLLGQDAQPVWFERQFDFQLGPHHVRGRIDRVDRIGGADGAATDPVTGALVRTEDGTAAEYELIDYKTSRPKSAEQLRDDIQLSLYALAAREDWGLECSRQAYYYVLDDVKVPVSRDERDAESIKDVVLEVGEGVLAQDFEPTPSHGACSICDYRIVCPAAEA